MIRSSSSLKHTAYTLVSFRERTTNTPFMNWHTRKRIAVFISSLCLKQPFFVTDHDSRGRTEAFQESVVVCRSRDCTVDVRLSALVLPLPSFLWWSVTFISQFQNQYKKKILLCASAFGTLSSLVSSLGSLRNAYLELWRSLEFYVKLGAFGKAVGAGRFEWNLFSLEPFSLLVYYVLVDLMTCR